MKSAIVTGANGFIGRNFIRYLVGKGVKVCAVDISHDNTTLRDLENVELIQAGLDELDKLGEYISADDEPEVFYHFAWAGTTGIRRADYALQLENAKYVCEAAKVSKSLGCRRFIAPGTITEKIVPYAIDHHCVSQGLTYAIAKVAASHLLEIVCKVEEIDHIWVRLSNIFGGDNTNGNLISYTLDTFKKGETPTYGPCLQPYNFTYIEDVVKALYLLGDKDASHKNTYFLSNGESRVLKDYLLEVADVFGKKVDIGVRADDGIKYEKEWFLDRSLMDDFGFSPSYLFSDAIRMIKEEESL
ncbi:MAG: NAD(P)-dependent oxidoreductase [Lachnospiraceae bacterium]|nr:NAD(P)-dependent oxidoreductase [Lachnospiraceae bacterium]